MRKKTREIGIAAAILLGLTVLLYLGGLLGQLLENYAAWQQAGGMAGQAQIRPPSPGVTDCLGAAFTLSGLKAMGILLLIAGGARRLLQIQRPFWRQRAGSQGLHRQQGGHLRHCLLDGRKRAERGSEGRAFGKSGRYPVG